MSVSPDIATVAQLKAGIDDETKLILIPANKIALTLTTLPASSKAFLANFFSKLSQRATYTKALKTKGPMEEETMFLVGLTPAQQGLGTVIPGAMYLYATAVAKYKEINDAILSAKVCNDEYNRMNGSDKGQMQARIDAINRLLPQLSTGLAQGESMINQLVADLPIMQNQPWYNPISRETIGLNWVGYSSALNFVNSVIIPSLGRDLIIAVGLCATRLQCIRSRSTDPLCYEGDNKLLYV